MPSRTLLALVVALAAALPARAQHWQTLSAEPPDVLLRAALESDYGQALADTFAVSVRRNGNPACLQTKGLDDAALSARGRALLQRYGARTLTTLSDNLDRSAYLAALAADVGPDAVEEIAALEREGDVKQLIALQRPARIARALDFVVAQFDRYVMLNRIKLDPVSPLGRGDPALIARSPEEASEAAVQRFADAHPSPRIDRYFELVAAAEYATAKAFAPVALKLVPAKFFSGVESELAELCVGRR